LNIYYKLIKKYQTDERESLQEAKPAWKIAASVLLKLFISGNEDATPLMPPSA